MYKAQSLRGRNGRTSPAAALLQKRKVAEVGEPMLNVDERATLPTLAVLADLVRRQIGRIVVGNDATIDLLLVALLCEGHVLLEDVPGVGKTLLARTLAGSLGCAFRRIQCTPDLLPSDVTGVAVFNQKTTDFEFRPGPIFTQILLADEINRATPRAQAALLEAMEERQVTAEGETRPLPRPFLVLATQNPVELEGTFPLPEAQLDRFLLRVRLGYPSEEDEKAVLRRFAGETPPPDVQPVIDAADLLDVASAVRTVHIGEAVLDYTVRLTRATRALSGVRLGASPRATLALARAGRAFAALRGRAFVIPDDIKALAPSVLAHRLIVDASTFRGGEADALIDECLRTVPVPVEETVVGTR
jgi:MoxR-like ATPase